MSQQLKKTEPWLILPVMVIAFAVIGLWPIQQHSHATDDNNDGIQDCTPVWSINGYLVESGDGFDVDRSTTSDPLPPITPTSTGVYEIISDLEVDTTEDHSCSDFSVKLTDSHGNNLGVFAHQGGASDLGRVFKVSLNRYQIENGGTITAELICGVHTINFETQKLNFAGSGWNDESNDSSDDPPCSSCDDCGKGSPLSCIRFSVPLGRSAFGKTEATLVYFDGKGSNNKGIGNLILGANSEFTVTRGGDGNLTSVEGDWYTVISPVSGGSNNEFKIEISTDRSNPSGTLIYRYTFAQSTYTHGQDSLTSLLITKENFANGGSAISSEVSEYAFKPSATGDDPHAAGALWIMEDGNGLRKRYLETVVIDETSKQERRSMYERASIATAWDDVAHKISEHDEYWHYYFWGKEKVKLVVDPLGDMLTSTWSYYDRDEPTNEPTNEPKPNHSYHGEGKLKQYVHHDGYVENHFYSANLHTIKKPFAGTEDASVTTYALLPTSNTQIVETKVNGTTVSKTETVYDTDVVTRRVYTSGVLFLDTVTEYYPSTDTIAPGQVKKITYPDGTILSKTYDYPDAETKIVTTFRGTADGGEGTTTKVTMNKLGATNLATVTNVGTGGSVVLSHKQIDDADRDHLGRAKRIDYFPGSAEGYSITRQYGCCGLQRETDRAGITTYYAYDGLKRRIKVNRLGLTTETRYDGLTTHSYRYPETGLVAELGTPSGTSANEISRSHRSLAGTEREQWSRNATGANYAAADETSTVTTYLNPAHTTQASLPAGIGKKSVTTVPQTADDTSAPTHTSETYLDGKTYQSYGTLSPDTRYSYAAGSAGLESTRTVGGGNLYEPVITRNDWAGRNIETEYLGEVKAHVYYNSKGQVVETSDPDRVRTFYEYNSKGQRTTTILDLNGNGVKDIGSDQYTLTTTTPGVYSDGTDNYEVNTTEITVFQDGASYPNGGTVVSRSHRTFTGLRSWKVSFPDGANLVTKSVTAMSGNGDVTVTTTAADRSYAVQTTTAGLLDNTESFDSAHNLITSTSYTDENGDRGYDAHNRLTHVTDSGTGTSETQYVNTVTDAVASVIDAAGNTTSFTYDVRSRRVTVDAPDTLDAAGANLANVTTTHYFPNGKIKEITGGQTYRRTYTYDYAARMKTLTTYGTVSSITAWNYDTGRGWLLSKRYNSNASGTSGTGPDYTYTGAGRLKTRTWARFGINGTTPVSTTYTYDFAGRLKKTLYSNESQGTPDLYNVYDRLSRPRFNIQGTLINGSTVRVHEYTYDTSNLSLDKETIVEGSYASGASGAQYTSSQTFNRVLDRSLDGKLRSAGWVLKNGATTEHSVSYGYRANDHRLNSVTGHGQSHTYGYNYTASTASRLGDITGASQGYIPYTITGPAHTVTNTYERHRNILTNKENKDTTGSLVRSNFLYTSNATGQRKSLTTSGSAFGAAPAYTWGYNDRGELVQADDTSSLNNDRAYQFDGIGNREKTANGLLGALPPTANYTPTALNQYSKANGVTLPVSAYDLDGNYTNGPLPGNQSVNATLVWDAENRLVSTTLSGTTTSYEYDYLGRRISKTQGTAITRYLYDGWNLVAEYTGATLSKSYTWGMDISGSMQGAGGVAGLLSVEVHAGANVGTYYPTYDGNGNVSEYLDGTGATVAHYEYDAFGNTLVSTGAKVNGFTHRFSTKPLDAETGLYYYGYRYYDPVTGRWPSRDSIEERGGLNLFGFVINDGVNAVDDLGMMPVEVKKYIDGDKNHVTIEIDETIASFPSRNGEGRGVTFIPKPWALVTFDLEASNSSGKCCLEVAFMDIGPYYTLIAGLAANKEGVLGHEQRHIIAYEKKVKEIEGTAKLIKACYEDFWEAFIKALQIQKRLTRSLQHARSSEQDHKDGGFNNPGTPKAGDDNYKPIPGFPATYK